jgi:hypothetical protein
MVVELLCPFFGDTDARNGLKARGRDAAMYTTPVCKAVVHS